MEVLSFEQATAKEWWWSVYPMVFVGTSKLKKAYFCTVGAMELCKVLWNNKKVRFSNHLFTHELKLIAYNPGQKCWDTCTFSLKIAPLRFPPPPSPSQCCISGLKVHFFGATLTRGEGGRHFAQTRPSRASKTERLANTCHIFRLSQGLLSRIVARGGGCCSTLSGGKPSPESVVTMVTLPQCTTAPITLMVSGELQYLPWGEVGGSFAEHAHKQASDVTQTFLATRRAPWDLVLQLHAWENRWLTASCV